MRASRVVGILLAILAALIPFIGLHVPGILPGNVDVVN